jgi:hypothetical protein
MSLVSLFRQYENLDAEHKGLFDGIFACAKNPGDAAALSHLATAVKNHFATEEVWKRFHMLNTRG